MEIHNPIDQQKKLNIITIADPSEYGKSALCYGKVLSVVFKASLTVVTNFGFSLENKGNPNALLTKEDLGTLDDGEMIVRDDYFFPERLYHYAEETNTIMFVIGVDNRDQKAFFNKRKAIRFIKPSRLPVLTVGKTLPTENAFQQVILPVDIERQAKEKALWAGYFSRFYQATIHILYPAYRDPGLRRQVSNNIDFVEKLYKNLEITYEINRVEPPKDLDAFSIEYAPQVDASLTVIMMTRYRTVADLFTGPRERKLIGNPQDFPILCINQRDDLYVLCT